MNLATATPRLALATAALMVLASCTGEEPAPDPTATATATATADPAPADTSSPEGRPVLSSSCTNPEGFSLSYPEGWFTNDGSVVSECSQFSPEQFDVPRGTDERVAPITAFIDPVPFARAAAPGPDQEQSRASAVIDGRQAVRIEKIASGDALYPAGTRQVMYLVDLSPGTDSEDARTLFLDTLDVGNFDYEANVPILDRMFRSLQVTAGEEPENAGRAVARYEGGGGAFTVIAEERDDEVCLRIPPEGEPSCVGEPTAGNIDTARLPLVGPENVLAGVAGEEVFRIDARQVDGDVLSFLPTAIAGGESRGWAFAGDAAEVEELIWFGLNGREIGRRSPD